MKSDREMMQALLVGETLVNTSNNEWKLDGNGCIIDTTGFGRYPKASDVEIKQKTININGFEVPEPLRKAPKIGALIFVVTLHYSRGPTQGDWGNTETQNEWLQNGILHSTKEAAQKHIEALLSFYK